MGGVGVVVGGWGWSERCVVVCQRERADRIPPIVRSGGPPITVGCWSRVSGDRSITNGYWRRVSGDRSITNGCWSRVSGDRRITNGYGSTPSGRSLPSSGGSWKAAGRSPTVRWGLSLRTSAPPPTQRSEAPSPFARWVAPLRRTGGRVEVSPGSVEVRERRLGGQRVSCPVDGRCDGWGGIGVDVQGPLGGEAGDLADEGCGAAQREEVQDVGPAGGGGVAGL